MSDIARADVVQKAEGNIEAPKSRATPEWPGAATSPGSESRACTEGFPRNLGDRDACSAKLPWNRGAERKRAKRGRWEVGAPQYEQGRGGTAPRDPAEQRAAPRHGTVGGKDDGDIELQHCL